MAMKAKHLARESRSPKIHSRLLPLIVAAVWLALPGVGRAFSITGVNLTPASPVPAGSNIVMTVNITTPSAGAWLYQPTAVSVEGNQVLVDVYPASGMLTVIWDFSTNVNLGVLPGGAYEYEVRLHPDRQVNWGTRTNRGQFTVLPTFPTTVVSVSAVDPQASEPGVLTVIDPGVFKVTRAGSTNFDLRVYCHIGGTAGNGVDYAAISNSIVIPAGQTSANIVINPRHDLLPEGTETVVLQIEPPICIAIYPPPPGCYQVGTPAEAVVSILDNDQPTNFPPQVQIIKPFDGQMFLSPTNVIIVSDTTDPDGYVGKVEFFADNNKIGEATKYFFAPPPPGEHIRYEFTWTNPPPGGHILGARATDDSGDTTMSAPVTVWVVTNLPPPVPIVTITATDPIAAEGTNCCGWTGWSNGTAVNFCGTNTATFVVRRTGHTNWTLRIFYQVSGTASNGVDYATLPGEVIVPPGRLGAEIKVVPIDDNLPERIETVVITLRAPLPTMNSAPPYIVGFPRRAAAIIVDNDQPRPVTGPLADHCFHIMKPGSNGSWFRIECSADLVNWTPICTNRVTDGALHFVDADADEAPQRFYRALPEPNPPEE
jgi:Bacterial Ig domain/Calx-beta domain